VKFAKDPTEALRAARHELEASLEENLLGLRSSTGESFDDFVHETRRCLQRFRAILRCYRPEIKRKEFSRLDDIIANAARTLSPIRDLAVMIGGLELFKAFFREDFETGDLRNILDRLRQQLLAERQLEVDRFAEQHGVTRLLRTLRSVFKRVDEVTEPITLSEKSLQQVIRKARYAIRCAETLVQKEPTPVTLHELRKKVKRLRYILDYLPLKGTSYERNKLKQRSEILGQWRDVYLLGTAIERFANEGEPDFQILQSYVMRLLSQLQSV